ncbi:hypothetical protein OS189_16980 [Sulfitobacter sp. F26169L]|uniref:hypothetical protein n=1 Tax=Sulfitobacter sp. F26169L TaxID=2996015 RepID=UPI002260C38D|nr:hypothetical protein [Sulfitobacter sp. F26169L]MCX7568039.1 hypothetical protein [Sulfitobacter sp. F26169L]
MTTSGGPVVLYLGQDPTRYLHSGQTAGMVFFAPVTGPDSRSDPLRLMHRDAAVVYLPHPPAATSAQASQALHTLWDTPHMGHPDVVVISGWYRLEALEMVLQKATAPLTLLVEDYNALLPEPRCPISLHTKTYHDSFAVISIDPAAIGAKNITRAIDTVQKEAATYTQAALARCDALAELTQTDHSAELARALTHLVLDEHHEPAWLAHIKQLAARPDFDGAQEFFAAQGARASNAVAATTALDLIARLQKREDRGDRGFAAALTYLRLSPGPGPCRRIVRAELQARINSHIDTAQTDALEQALVLTAGLTPSIRDSEGCTSFGSLLYKGLKALLDADHSQQVADICATVPDRFTAVKRMAVLAALNLQQPDTAMQHWRTLLERDPAAARTLQQNIPSMARLRDDRRRLTNERHAALRDPPLPHRHIAIAGVSYCGSTFLGAVLGSIPGVAHIGESIWLAHRKTTGQPLIDRFTVPQEYTLYCTQCGPDCQVLTPSLRRSLIKKQTNWYGRIAQALDTPILVSSDKNLSKIRQLDPMLRMDAIVLYKSPIQAWWSNYRKIGSSGFAPVENLDHYLDVWSAAYEIFLDHFAITGRTVVMSQDAFTTTPDAVFSRLCALLDLPWSNPEMPLITRDQHFIGGNAIVQDNLRSDGPPPAVRPLPQVELPDAHFDIIANHNRAQNVIQRLDASFAKKFDLPVPLRRPPLQQK